MITHLLLYRYQYFFQIKYTAQFSGIEFHNLHLQYHIIVPFLFTTHLLISYLAKNIVTLVLQQFLRKALNAFVSLNKNQKITRQYQFRDFNWKITAFEAESFTPQKYRSKQRRRFQYCRTKNHNTYGLRGQQTYKRKITYNQFFLTHILLI